MKSGRRRSCFVLLCLMQSALAVENVDTPGNSYQLPGSATRDGKSLPLEVSSGYDSLYMFKGVNLQPNAGIYWLGVAPTWVITPRDTIQVPFWYATSVGKTIGGVNQNYREFDVPVNFNHTAGDFSLGVGYHLFTYFNLNGVNPGGTGIQNELAFSSSYKIRTGSLSWIPSLSYFYELGTSNHYSYGSINPGSGFLSPQLTLNVPIYKDLVTLNPFSQYNFSFGYNYNQQHEYLWGGNNWQITAPVTWRINRILSLTGYVSYSYQCQSLIGTAPDTFWAGGNVTLSF